MRIQLLGLLMGAIVLGSQAQNKLHTFYDNIEPNIIEISSIEQDEYYATYLDVKVQGSIRWGRNYYNNLGATSVIAKMDQNHRKIWAINNPYNMRFSVKGNLIFLYSNKGNSDYKNISIYDTSGRWVRDIVLPFGAGVDKVTYSRRTNSIVMIGHLAGFYDYSHYQFVSKFDFGKNFKFNVNHYDPIAFFAHYDTSGQVKFVKTSDTLKYDNLELKELLVDNKGNSYFSVNYTRYFGFGGKSYSASNFSMALFKIDSLGNLLWSHGYDDYQIGDKRKTLALNSKDELIMCKNAGILEIDSVQISATWQLILVNFSETGKIKWNKTYYVDRINSFIIDNNDNIAICGLINPNLKIKDTIDLHTDESLNWFYENAFYAKFDNSGQFKFGYSLQPDPTKELCQFITNSGDYKFEIWGRYSTKINFFGNPFYFLSSTLYVAKIGCELPKMAIYYDKATFCEGDSSLLTCKIDQTNYPYQLSWMKDSSVIPSSNTQKYNAKKTAKYSLLLNMDAVCKDTSNYINIVVKPNPQPVIKGAQSKTSFCQGKNLIIFNSTDQDKHYTNYDSILWSNGEKSQSLTVNQAGKFKLTAAVNGCFASSPEFEVKMDTLPSKPYISITNCLLSCKPYAKNMYKSIYWYVDGQSYSIYDNEPEITAFSGSKKDYEIRVVDNNGCISPISNKVYLGCNMTDIASTNTNYILNIYPSPFESVLNIDLNKAIDNFELEIVGVDGRIIFNNSYKNQSSIEIDLTSLNAGVYFVRMKINNEHRIYKVVKSNG